MELNSKALQEVVQLNLDLIKFNNQISTIKDLIKQLLQDKCDLSVSLKMHNETKCEENKAVQQRNANSMFHESILPQLGSRMSGHPAYRTIIDRIDITEDQEVCKNTLNFKITDTNGVRILNILLSEKLSAKQLILCRLNQLINPINIVFPDSNPIAERYSAE